MKNFLMVIGLPGIGKSTYIKNYFPDCKVLSTDNLIEAYAKAMNLSYTDVFKEYIGEATDRFFESLELEMKIGTNNIVIDRTNLTALSRKKIMNYVSDNYVRNAIVLTCSEEEHVKRLAGRPDKQIPPYVIESMRKRFEKPTVSEQFDMIYYREI